MGALLCTQRPIYARIDLISKKFLSIIIYSPRTRTRSGELAARAQNVAGFITTKVCKAFYEPPSSGKGET